MDDYGDYFRRLSRGEASPPPVAQLLGFDALEAGEGTAAVLLEAGARHTNPMGTVHGGILCDIADAAMGAAFATTLDEDESFTSLDLRIDFLRPVWETTLTAEAEVRDRGRAVGLVECAVRDGEGRLVATSR